MQSTCFPANYGFLGRFVGRFLLCEYKFGYKAFPQLLQNLDDGRFTASQL